MFKFVSVFDPYQCWISNVIMHTEQFLYGKKNGLYKCFKILFLKRTDKDETVINLRIVGNALNTLRNVVIPI